MMFNRWSRAAIMLAALFATSVAARPTKPARAARPTIALTFDDIPAHGPLPVGETRLDVANALIAALRAAHAPAFGFVNGGFELGNPLSAKVMAAWRAAGLPLGNHTYNHPSLNQISAADFLAQVGDDEATIAPLMKGRDWRWFRYPFLDEGDTPAKQAAVRTWLAAHHYRIAAVTNDFSDWGWNDVYAGCVAKGDPAIIDRLEHDFLQAARESALNSRRLSRQLYHRDVPQVLLMHMGAFSAYMLPRVLDLYRALGFRFVTLARAESDPFYAAAANPRLPGPSPTFEDAAIARNIPVPASFPMPADGLCAQGG